MTLRVGDAFTPAENAQGDCPSEMRMPGFRGMEPMCVLEKGHDGDHAAVDGTTMKVVFVWTDDDQVS